MKKLIYLTLGLLIIGFTSCKDDEPIEPGKKNSGTEASSASMDFTINHTVGDQDFITGTQYIVGDNDKATFSRYAYLLGSFYLTTQEGTEVVLDSQYALIEAHNEMTTFTLTEVPFGTYTSIGFSVGLDSETNHGNPNQYSNNHPLNSNNNSLHWGWTGGYIFTAIEGKDMGGNESVSFHLAGAQNKTDFVLDTKFTHGETGSEVILEYDIAEMFTAPSTYSFAIDGHTAHSVSDPVTTKLFGNMVDVFSLTSATSK
jgi:hypothetical protein